MISNPFFLISILASAFLAFITMAFIVEIAIKLFSIKKYRIRSLLRLLPFFSLTIDFIFQRFSIGNWLNPLSCASCVQKFVLQMFFPELKQYLTATETSLVQYLAFNGFDNLFSSIFIAFCCVTGFFFLRKVSQVFFIRRSLRLIEKQGTGYKITIQNPELEQALVRAKAQLIINECVQMPMTGYKRMIFIPSNLSATLSPEEMEAVIAHELEHVRHKDSFFKVACQTMASFAWWIPTHSWMKKMEQDQELACDEGTAKYGCKHTALASAMVKVAKQVGHPSDEEICYFTEQKNSALVRIQVLLGLLPHKRENLLWSGVIGVSIGALVFWGCLRWL